MAIPHACKWHCNFLDCVEIDILTEGNYCGCNWPKSQQTAPPSPLALNFLTHLFQFFYDFGPVVLQINLSISELFFLLQVNRFGVFASKILRGWCAMPENKTLYITAGVVVGVLILIISLIGTSLEKLDSDEGQFHIICMVLSHHSTPAVSSVTARAHCNRHRYMCLSIHRSAQ